MSHTNLLEQEIEFNANKQDPSVNCFDNVLCPSWQYCASDGHYKCGESPHDIIHGAGNIYMWSTSCNVMCLPLMWSWRDKFGVLFLSSK